MTGIHTVEVTMVVAATRNNVIGSNGEMPFRLKSDMKHFRATTMGHPVVMGRKTWLTLPKPLDGRRNIVMSTNSSLQLDGADVAGSIDEVLALCGDESEIMVIGGGEIYRLWLPFADRILLSRVDVELDGDTTFPALDPVEWHCIRFEPQPADEGDEYGWALLELVRHVAEI